MYSETSYKRAVWKKYGHKFLCFSYYMTEYFQTALIHTHTAMQMHLMSTGYLS